jgi:DNA-binding FrmR family transcriptional regulator
MTELLERHIRHHVLTPAKPNSEQTLAADEVIDVKTYLR